MTEDDVFRLLLAASFLLMAPVGIYHRIQAARSGEKLDRSREGWWMLIGLRLLGVVLFGSFLLYLIRPESLSWFRMPLPTWLRVLGLAIGFADCFLIVAVFRHLGRNLTDTVVTRRQHTLVTTGPYRWVRHPFYVAYLASVIAVTLVTANAYFAIAGGLTFVLLYVRTTQEEAELLRRFGDEYRRYMQTTGRFFPRVGEKLNAKR